MRFRALSTALTSHQAGGEPFAIPLTDRWIIFVSDACQIKKLDLVPDSILSREQGLHEVEIPFVELWRVSQKYADRQTVWMDSANTGAPSTSTRYLRSEERKFSGHQQRFEEQAEERTSVSERELQRYLPGGSETRIADLEERDDCPQY